LGRRSRKRRQAGSPAAAVRPREDDRLARGYARGRAKDVEARAGLAPLHEGERPRAVTVAAVVALAIALGNLIGFAAGWEVDGERPSTFGFLAFEVVMLALAWGLWRSRYWAVLGFQALLGITIVIAAMGLLVASNLRAVVLSVGIIAAAAPLFWSLVRAMARIQMPRRPGAHSD
jgi:hypothetical protein